MNSACMKDQTATKYPIAITKILIVNPGVLVGGGGGAKGLVA